MEHDAEPINRDQSEPETGRGCRRERRPESRTEYPSRKEAEQPVSLVNMAKSGNHAQKDRDQIAGLSFRALARVASQSQRSQLSASLGSTCPQSGQLIMSGGDRFPVGGDQCIPRVLLLIRRCRRPRSSHAELARPRAATGEQPSSQSSVHLLSFHATLRRMPSVQEVVTATSYLRIGEIEDWPNALNGLQIENSEALRRSARRSMHRRRHFDRRQSAALIFSSCITDCSGRAATGDRHSCTGS